MNEEEFRSRFKRAIGKPSVLPGLTGWPESRLPSNALSVPWRWVAAGVVVGALGAFVLFAGDPASHAVGNLVGHHEGTAAVPTPSPSASPAHHEPSPPPPVESTTSAAVAGARADAQQRTGVPADQWDVNVVPTGQTGARLFTPCPNLMPTDFPPGTRYMIVLTAKDRFMIYTSTDGTTATYWWGSDKLDQLKAGISDPRQATSIPAGARQAVANSEADAQRRTGITADKWQVSAVAIPVPTGNSSQCSGLRTGYLIQLFATGHALAYRSDDGANVELLTEFAYSGPSPPADWPTPPVWPEPPPPPPPGFAMPSHP